MITTTPFRSWHLKLFKPGKHYQSVALDPELKVWMYRQMEGVTLLKDGEIVAIMGVIPCWSGVGEVTFIPSDLFYSNLRESYVMTKQLLATLFLISDYHRVQATALVGHDRHINFLKHLGFVEEGTLIGYGPNKEDYKMFRYQEA